MSSELNRRFGAPQGFLSMGARVERRSGGGSSVAKNLETFDRRTAIIRSVMTMTKMKSWDAKSCRDSREISLEASTSLTNAQPREYTTQIDDQHNAIHIMRKEGRWNNLLSFSNPIYLLAACPLQKQAEIQAMTRRQSLDLSRVASPKDVRQTS